MKTVLITGASRGIGRATALKFLSVGWRVFGTSRSDKIDIDDENFTPLKLDLTIEQSIEHVAWEVENINLKLDILINNAGVRLDQIGLAFNMELLRPTLEVNLIGAAILTEKLLPFIVQGGHIVNISSGHGTFAVEEDGDLAAAYSISKAALNMLTLRLARWLKDKDIVVSAMTPGRTRTAMGGPDATQSPEAAAEAIYSLATAKVESGKFWREGIIGHW